MWPEGAYMKIPAYKKFGYDFIFCGLIKYKDGVGHILFKILWE